MIEILSHLITNFEKLGSRLELDEFQACLSYSSLKGDYYFVLNAMVASKLEYSKTRPKSTLVSKRKKVVSDKNWIYVLTAESITNGTVDSV